MSDQPESLAAIIAEMRDERIIRLDGADVTRCLLRNLADRIEAAAERERAEDADGKQIASCWGGDGVNCTEPAQSDAALIVAAVNERDRLRDALKRIIDATYDIDKGCPDFRAIARAALGEDKE